MKFKTITFYKFFDIEKPEELVIFLRELCEKLGLKGRILIGKEGINAGVSGKNKKIKKFKEEIMKEENFHDLTFRENLVEKNSYHKLVVRAREEVITLGKKVDMKNKAEYILQVLEKNN